MASAVADLESGLQAMLNLKPPGVSGSRISSLTTLCVSNIASESVLIQKIYTHFKKAPKTHKLGVLYVVDSVTRKWLEQAKAHGQPVNVSAQDGTYAAGVHRVTELMPVLMNDILQSAPEEQKEKIRKLLDIWEKGQTFPTSIIETFKEKLNAPQQNSTTPPGSPPADVLASLQNNAPPPTTTLPTNGSSILEALAKIARQNTTTAPSNASVPAATASYPTMPSTLTQPPATSTPPATTLPYSQASQPLNMSSLPFAMNQAMGHTPQPAGAPSASNSNPYPGGSAAPGSSSLDSNTQQQILLIKALADQGVPFDKIPALIQSMTGNSGAGPYPQPPSAASQSPFSPGQPWNAPAPLPTEARDRGYQDGNRSPSRYHGRSRSRSPERGWGARGSPRGGREYGRVAPHGRFDDRDRDSRRGGDYRQRSPQGRHGRSESPGQDTPTGDKWVDFDPNLPSGHIKVLSRTLFVGGVTCSEAELRNLFTRFGTVQTCIVNKDKRHAFVKMISRKDAVCAKEGTEDHRNLELPLRTRWGVGFGPRDCSDYSSGISVIPIHKLTEADRKWMLTAPYGGSGGRPIDTGICVEEPDIEIGAGVSSKAISRRMQTDKGGSNGPKSTRHNEDLTRWRRSRDGPNNGGGNQRGGEQRDDGMTNPPMMPGFPFGIGTLPNGMPNFPAGFAFPDPQNHGGN